MDVRKAKRLALGIAAMITAMTAAASLLASGTYASPVDGGSWILAEDWEDTKDDEPTTATTTAPIAAPSDEQIVVSGKKTWNHGDNPAAKRPNSITVLIKADGAVVVQRLITAANHWAWSFKLPKYNGSREITYTVDEARFEDYVKIVDGHNLTNIYMPGHNTDEPWPPGTPGGSPPGTDDSSNPALWLALMGISLFGLALVIIPLRRKRREANRS